MSNFIAGPQKEFLLTDCDFSYLREIAANVAGFDLTEEKRELVYGRLTKRLRSLGMKNFRQYCNCLKGYDKNSKEELTNFISLNDFNKNNWFKII